MNDILDLTNAGSMPIPITRLRLADPSGYVIQVNSDQGDRGWMVRIATDGSVTFGETYDPDEAARTFWTFLASTMRTWWFDRTPEAEIVAAAKALPLDEIEKAVEVRIVEQGDGGGAGQSELAALARLRSALSAVVTS